MTTAVQAEHAAEVKSGNRFEFGKNWSKFLKVLNEERIVEAELSLKSFLDVTDLKGQSFLDVGSGSGLFSLAARRLGATVLSFDYDPQSVACTGELRRRYFPGDADWRVTTGSVLDRGFLDGLGQHDVVYSWGVLHHTGAMWQAMENVMANVKVGGALFIAIYNDCGSISRYWLEKKIRYNSKPSWLKLPYAIWVWAPMEIKSFIYYLCKSSPSQYFAQWTQYKKSRGMSRWHDMIDWIGGYPYEYASARQLTEFYEERSFETVRVKENNGYGCHQLVFRRLR